ncbi:MAG: fuculose phosphate aldolase [Dethiosulfovibrio peptidovorans]|nr:MAG: fuculose phosphate aldolase [Dethiosulfovibrio peptidovorans]
MRMRTEREEIVRYGMKLLEEGLTTGTGGNLSVFHRASGIVALSPSGIPYRETQPEDVVLMTSEGDFVDRAHRIPTSEWELHLTLYRKRPDISAVVHCHSDYATAVSCLGVDLPAVNYMVAVVGDKVPLTPFGVYGTRDLAEKVADNIGGYDGALMANHGQVALGQTLKAAFTVALNVEYVARLYILAKSVGEPSLLSRDDIKRTRERFRSYGQERQ